MNEKEQENDILVRKHLLHSLSLENPLTSLGTLTIIQQRGNDLTILNRSGKATGTASLESAFKLALVSTDERPSQKMSIGPEFEFSVWEAMVHIRQALLHLIGWHHIDVCDAEGLENVLLEVIVQTLACDAFKKNACPINVDAIFPLLAWLIHKWLAYDVGP